MLSLGERAQFMPVSGIDYIPLRPFQWEVGWQGSGNIITIPAVPFQSSVPWYARWIVSPHHEPWLLAAAVHDGMLREGYPAATSSAEWLTANRAMHEHLLKHGSGDSKQFLAVPAYHGINLATVR